MQKYRQHVQQLQLMDEKEKIAVQLFNAGLAQVNTIDALQSISTERDRLRI